MKNMDGLLKHKHIKAKLCVAALLISLFFNWWQYKNNLNQRHALRSVIRVAMSSLSEKFLPDHYSFEELSASIEIFNDLTEGLGCRSIVRLGDRLMYFRVPQTHELLTRKNKYYIWHELHQIYGHGLDDARGRDALEGLIDYLEAILFPEEVSAAAE